MRKSYIIAAVIIGIAALWVLSGQFGDAPAPEVGGPNMAAPEQTEERSLARVAHLVAKPITSKVIIQGETQPNRSVDIKSELRGPVIEVLVERGAKVTEGQALVRIADNGRTQQLEKAKAALELRQAEFEAAKSLTQKGINSRIRLTEATSNLRSAEAELKLREIDVDNLVIKAPFDGVLDERFVRAGDSAEMGMGVARVVELDPIKVVGQISESNVSDIALGMTSEVELVDGRVLEATLRFRSSTADTETRTFEIELEAPNPDGEIIGGLTATIKLPTGTKRGHLVSPSVLTLSDSGAIGVKIVDEQSRVRFKPVVILDEGPDGTWISGLAEEVDLITVGQDFVAEGELVERVFVDASGGAS